MCGFCFHIRWWFIQSQLWRGLPLCSAVQPSVQLRIVFGTKNVSYKGKETFIRRERKEDNKEILPVDFPSSVSLQVWEASGSGKAKKLFDIWYDSLNFPVVKLDNHVDYMDVWFYRILFKLLTVFNIFVFVRIKNKDCIWLLISTWRMTNDEWHSHTDLDIPVTGIWTISVKVCMWLFLLLIICRECFLSDTQNFLQQINNCENPKLCSTFKLELSSFQCDNSNQTFKDIFLWNQFKVTSLNFLSVFAPIL